MPARLNERMDNRMGKILDALFSGELNIDNGRTPRQQELFEKAEEYHRELEKRLNGEDREILDRLVETVMDGDAQYAQEMFLRGYCLGTLINTEVFLERDLFLTRK